jgi:hypothetical protein
MSFSPNPMEFGALDEKQSSLILMEISPPFKKRESKVTFGTKSIKKKLVILSLSRI